MLAITLGAVLALAWLARVMELGGDARIASAAQAHEIALDHHFESRSIVLDRAGMSALARDDAGGFLLIRRHGAHFVAERLVPPLRARLDHRFLSINGTVLDLGDDAPVWAAQLRLVA